MTVAEPFSAAVPLGFNAVENGQHMFQRWKKNEYVSFVYNYTELLTTVTNCRVAEQAGHICVTSYLFCSHTQNMTSPVLTDGFYLTSLIKQLISLMFFLNLCYTCCNHRSY